MDFKTLIKQEKARRSAAAVNDAKKRDRDTVIRDLRQRCAVLASASDAQQPLDLQQYRIASSLLEVSRNFPGLSGSRAHYTILTQAAFHAARWTPCRGHWVLILVLLLIPGPALHTRLRDAGRRGGHGSLH